MKTINKLLGLLLMATVALVGCNRDFDAPPLEKPVYNGPEENITIKELKNKYKDVTSDAPRLVEVDYILKARVISSDESGNIFKQLYIYDESGYGINMGVDQNSLYTEYYIGQEVFVDLHGLYIVNYGDQLQIGMANTQANRIPFKTFQEHVSKNGWPKPDAVKPAPLKFTELEDRMVNTLVTFDNVYFADGGKLPYVDGTQTTNRDLKFVDGEGVVLVRTSSYANFAKETLPKGKGTVTGILSKFKTDWQLTILNKEDVKNFDGSDITETKPEPVEGTLFSESFGPKFAKGDNPWPKVGAYSDYDNKNVKFSDSFNEADIRNTKSIDNHVWLPGNKDSEFKIEGIDVSNTNGKDLTLIYSVAPNLYNAGETNNINSMTITYNGKTLSVPNIPLTNDDHDKAKVIEIKGLQPSKNATVLFSSKGADNKLGLRLLDVKLVIGDGAGSVDPTEPTDPTNPTDPTDPTGPVEPAAGSFTETFGAKFDKGSDPWPKVGVYTGYDNKNLTYSDATSTSDIRNTKDLANHVWFTKEKDSEFEITGMANVAGKSITLTYDAAANVYSVGETTNLNTLEVWYNGKQLQVESKEVAAKDDFNKFYTLKIQENIIGVEGASLKFVAKSTSNKYGLRLANIKFSVK